MKDDKFEHEEVSSKHDEDDEDFDKRSVTSTSTTRSKSCFKLN
jgi:hypothetical protein